MKKLFSMVLALAVVLSCAGALADTLVPYEGDAVSYSGYAADLGIMEDRESPVYQAYKALTGDVTIEWSTAPWGDFDTTTSMFLNTGDLPDIVWLRGPSSVVSNYGDMDYFLNFMDYLDYMPNLTKYIEEYPQFKRMMTEDGALYCVLDVEPYDSIQESFYVNKTELDALGMEVPTTWDGMLEAMRAFKAAKPEATPFITYGWGLSYYQYALGSINDAHTDFYYDGEKWVHPLLEESSGYRELTDMLRTMYSEGLLHPEFSTMSDEQAYQIVTDGEWLFSFFYTSCISDEIFLGDPIPYEVQPMLTPAHAEGDPIYEHITVTYDATPGWGYFVNVDVENPELMCSLVDTIISPEASLLYNWGVKDLTYAEDEDGNRTYLEDYGTSSESRQAAGVRNLMDVRYIQYKMRDTDYAGGSDLAKASYDMVVHALIDGTALPVVALRGTPILTAEVQETVAMNTTPIKTYIDENIILFIDGTRAMDEWDAFVEETKQYGDFDAVLEAYENGEQVIMATERKYITYD